MSTNRLIPNALCHVAHTLIDNRVRTISDSWLVGEAGTVIGTETITQEAAFVSPVLSPQGIANPTGRDMISEKRLREGAVVTAQCQQSRSGRNLTVQDSLW